MRTLIILAMAFVLMAGCAHVPKESVELSATVGRDIATVHKSHIELARLLFQQMRADVNRFVDDVYAPAQIRAVMERQWALARSTNEDDQNKSILLAINDAMLPGADPALQADVLGAMGDMVSHIHADVESMRQELLGRLDGQEDTVIASIDRAYQQIHYGNSIVTGYLSSVVQVTDAQAEMLAPDQSSTSTGTVTP